MYLDEVKALFAEINAQAHLTDWVIPCTENEVSALEQKLGLVLPQTYIEFLLWMGHGAGSFLQGESVFYQDLPLDEEARQLLVEDGIAIPLPEDAFVFYMHQGYQFMFMRLTEGPNPPVYYYGEEQAAYLSEEQRERTFTLLYESFSAFLVATIEEHGSLRKERARLQSLRMQRQQEGGAKNVIAQAERDAPKAPNDEVAPTSMH